MEKSKTRLVYIDVIKIIACFLVVVNHTNSRVFLCSSPCATWFVSIIYYFCCKTAVPLFIMASGATLLSKDETYKKTFLRAGRILAVIIIFSIIIYWRNFSISGLLSFLHIIYKHAITNAYWYLYAYFGLLLMAPLIRKMIKNFSKTDYIYLSIVSVGVLGLLPVLARFLPEFAVFSVVSVSFFPVFIGLFVLGYFLSTNEIYSKFTICLCMIIIECSICAEVLLTTKLYYINNNDYLFLIIVT